MKLLPLAVKLASASMSLNLISVKPLNNPELTPKIEAIFVMSEIKYLVNIINNKHCQ